MLEQRGTERQFRRTVATEDDSTRRWKDDSSMNPNGLPTGPIKMEVKDKQINKLKIKDANGQFIEVANGATDKDAHGKGHNEVNIEIGHLHFAHDGDRTYLRRQCP